MADKCKHLRILVVRTYDLKCEWPTCEDCGELVLNWASRPHVFGKHTYRYKYADADYFASRKGVLTDRRERTA